MTSVTKNMYIDKADNIVKKYNNTYHRTFKMNLVDVKPSTYIDPGKENNEKNRKFEVSYFVRISKYKSAFAKGYFPNWSEEVYVITKVSSDK